MQHSRAAPQADLEALFRKHAELRLCQDISNGTKHQLLDDPKLGQEFALVREYVPPPVGLPSHDTGETYSAISPAPQVDLFDLADTCMALWEEFISLHSLEA